MLGARNSSCAVSGLTYADEGKNNTIKYKKNIIIIIKYNKIIT